MIVVDDTVMVDVHEAAEIARRDPETIRRWVRSGRVSARRHGNKWLIDRDDIERLVDGRPTSPLITLAEWAGVAAKIRLASGHSDSTAADLILADRANH